MKTLNFIYQETEIHFALQNEGNVMVNATEMAKLFGKKIPKFLKADHVENFIKELELTPYGVSSSILTRDDIIQSKNGVGTYFHRLLALKFAAWLDPKFELWVFATMDNIIFGHYKEHWEAHKQQEAAKMDMATIKKKLLLNPTPELAEEYFRAEERLKFAKNDKVKAIRNQIKLF